MSSLNAISPDKLLRLLGRPDCPALIDVRLEEDFAADPRLIPGSLRRPHESVGAWAGDFAGRSAVVICQRGCGTVAPKLSMAGPHIRADCPECGRYVKFVKQISLQIHICCHAHRVAVLINRLR